MRYISLTEYQTSPPLDLSVKERDSLRALVSDLRVEPAPGLENAYLVTPASTIGSIALEGLVIEIRPKLPVERVLFLLSYSLGLARWGDTAVEVSPDASLIEALVPVFTWHCKRALRRGVLQGYRTEETSIMGVRGRLCFDEQVKKRFGVPLPMEVRYDEFTEDIVENRLIKAAANRLGRLRLRSESSRQELHRLDHVLELVNVEAYDRSNLPTVHYNRLNEHYRGAVEWARLILRLSSFETRHGKASAAIVLFDMNDVFEDFVRSALREDLALTPREFPTGKECPSLFLDAAHRVSLQPDLSWWAGTQCRLVGDVKYKVVNVRGVKHPDLYQLLAYATGTGLPDALLVYAAGAGDPATHAVTLAGKSLHVRSLVLDGSIESVRKQVGDLAVVVRLLARNIDAAA